MGYLIVSGYPMTGVNECFSAFPYARLQVRVLSMTTKNNVIITSSSNDNDRSTDGVTNEHQLQYINETIPD